MYLRIELWSLSDGHTKLPQHLRKWLCQTCSFFLEISARLYARKYLSTSQVLTLTSAQFLVPTHARHPKTHSKRIFMRLREYCSFIPRIWACTELLLLEAQCRLQLRVCASILASCADTSWLVNLSRFGAWFYWLIHFRLFASSLVLKSHMLKSKARLPWKHRWASLKMLSIASTKMVWWAQSTDRTPTTTLKQWGLASIMQRRGSTWPQWYIYWPQRVSRWPLRSSLCTLMSRG